MLPYTSTLMNIFSSGTSRAFCTARMILMLAWWGTTRDKFIDADLCSLEDLTARRGHPFDGLAEDLSALHDDFFVITALGAVKGKRRSGAAHLETEDLRLRTVGAGGEGEHLGDVATGSHDGCPRRVTEEYAGGTVVPVHLSGEQFHTHHEHPSAVLCGSGLGDVEGQNKAGAPAAGQIVGQSFTCAEPVLQVRRCVRDDDLRGVCGDDDLIDVTDLEPGIGECPPGSLSRQVDRGLVRRRDSAGLNSGPVGDPLVGGVHVFGPLIVGHDPVGRVGARPMMPVFRSVIAVVYRAPILGAMLEPDPRSW